MCHYARLWDYAKALHAHRVLAHPSMAGFMLSRWACETGVRMRVLAARILYISLLKLSLGRSISAFVSTTWAHQYD